MAGLSPAPLPDPEACPSVTRNTEMEYGDGMLAGCSVLDFGDGVLDDFGVGPRLYSAK